MGVEAVVVAGGVTRGDADPVAIKDKVHVDRLALRRRSEGLLEAQALVEGSSPRKVVAEQDDLRTVKRRYERQPMRRCGCLVLWRWRC